MIGKSLHITAVINLIILAIYLAMFIFSKDVNCGIFAIIFLINFYKTIELYKGVKNDINARKN